MMHFLNGTPGAFGQHDRRLANGQEPPERDHNGDAARANCDAPVARRRDGAQGRLARSVSSGLRLMVHDSGTDCGLKHTLSSHAW